MHGHTLFDSKAISHFTDALCPQPAPLLHTQVGAFADEAISTKRAERLHAQRAQR